MSIILVQSITKKDIDQVLVQVLLRCPYVEQYIRNQLIQTKYCQNPNGRQLNYASKEAAHYIVKQKHHTKIPVQWLPGTIAISATLPHKKVL